MVIRKIFIVIGAASCFALPSNSGAQSNPALYEPAHQIAKQMLDDSAATRERAAARVRENNYYEAATEYEALVGRWQGTPDSLLSYPVLMALGGAHLEAAINLVSYG